MGRSAGIRSEQYGTILLQQIVWVKVSTPERSAILGDVVCRVSPSYARAMHIDTDESNAIGAGRELYGEIAVID